jgi:2-dehydropantoate 2-reductase
MIVILGAGAVGCFYGGLIAASGQEVVLIAKPQRAKIIREQGLQIKWPTYIQHIQINVTDDYQVIQNAKALFICVKANQSTAVAKQIQPFLAKNTLVLSLQNGLQNAARFAEILGRPIDVAMIYAALSMSAENEVSYQGGGKLVLGRPIESDNADHDLNQLAGIFQRAACQVSISSNITHDLWSKWIINCAFNALSALGQINYQDLVQQTNIPEIIDAIVQECFSLAKAEKVSLDEQFILSQIQNVAINWPRQKSSMAQDLMAKRPTEIAELNGLAQEKGALFNISTPMNTLLTTLIKMQERLYLKC